MWPVSTTGGLSGRLGMPQEVVVLSIAGFCVSVGFGVMIPVLPLFARSFGVGNTETGLVVAAFAATRLVTSPFTGRINAWLGERTVVGLGMLGVAAFSVAAGLAQTFTQLLVFRGLQGVGSALFTVAAISLVLSSVPAEKRGRASGVYQGGFLLGGMLGPALGGLVAGVSMAAPFFFYAAMLVVAAAIVMGKVKKPRADLDAEGAEPRPLREVIRDRGFQAACVTAFGQGWQSFGVRSALVPILVVETLGAGTAWTGIAFAIAAVAQTIALAPAGRATDMIGRRPVMILAGLVTAAATFALPFSPSLAILIALLCVYGVGAAMQGTAPTAAVGDAARGPGGAPIALFSMTTDVGGMLGPVLAGWLADQVSMGAAFAVGGVVLLCGAAVSATMPRRLPGRADPS